MPVGAAENFTVMKGADSVFLDTNVLLDATVPSRPRHSRATQIFRMTSREVTLCISGQVIREYVGVCTRPQSGNGLGLSVENSLRNVEVFLRFSLLLEETSSVADKWRSLVSKYQVSGKQVHDACIVATALSHGVFHIVTSNPDDFARYQDLITLLTVDLRP